LKRLAGLALAAAGAGAFVHARVRQAAELHPARGHFAAGLHYVEAGFGPSVVLLHGLGAMLEDFQLSGLFTLAAKQFRVLAFDRAGYGHSKASALDPHAQARLLHQAFEDLRIGRPILVAHSAGTQVALAYALQFPRQLRGLVLLSGYYYPTMRPDLLLLAPPALPLVGTLLRHTISPIVGRLLWPAWLKLLFDPLPVPEYLPAWRALAPAQLRTVGVESAMLLPVTMKMRRQYWKVRTPTVIVAGTEDRYVSSRAHSRRLNEDLRFSTYLEIPEAGHMVHHAAPDAVMRAIQAAAA
jgi:pimeloyl-ACP methyl ester carboxylesterase